MKRLQGMLQRALEHTASLYLEVAYDWVKAAVRILNNEDHADGQTVKARYQGLINRFSRISRGDPYMLWSHAEPKSR